MSVIDVARCMEFVGTQQNINNETNLYVNLRCMQINQDHISLYIGGGITAASMAEKEWEETQRKAQTLLVVL